MGFYETTYILHSALQEGRLNDIVNTIQKKAESLGANFLYSDNWGRKKLAYLIDKEKYGTYIFIQYSLKDAKALKELSAEFEHNPNVLRYLNIKIEEDDVFKKVVKEEISDKNESKNKASEQVEDSKGDEKTVDAPVKEEAPVQEEIINDDNDGEEVVTEDENKEENSGDDK